MTALRVVWIAWRIWWPHRLGRKCGANCECQELW